MVIVNGLGYDTFMDKLLAASRNRHRQVLSGQDPRRQRQRRQPHLWYDTARVPLVAQAILSALTTKDPADKAAFQAGLERFDASLQPLLQVLQTIKTRHSHAPVAYTERVPAFLLQHAGLDIRTPAGFGRAIEEGNEPSAADRTAMEQLMTGRQVNVLLYNA